MLIPTAQPACRSAISRTLSEHTSIILQYVNWESLTNNRLWNRDVRKTEILFGLDIKNRTKSEPSKNVTSVQTVFTVFRQTACNSQFRLKLTKITLLAFNVQIKNVLDTTATEFSI